MINTDYTIWTDGGCAKNPNGKGGYGVVIKNNIDGNVSTFSEGFKSSTNNRMEVRAIIRALSEIPDNSTALIYSDSKYAVMTFNGEFKKKKNVDLWNIADELLARKNNVIFEWVKGHADNENNNKCDELATEAMKKDEADLIDDVGFVPIEPKEFEPKIKSTNSISAMDVVIEPMLPDEYVNDACYSAICAINSLQKPSFSDFANLKSYGFDFWSHQPIEALEFYFGSCVVGYIKDYVDDEKSIASVLRWKGRGLTIENAIRKVLVDNEIKNNIVAKE